MYVATGGFGDEQLTVIEDGAKLPTQGQWILKSEVSSTQAMIESIVAGNGNVSIEETTEPWLFGLFYKTCPGFKEEIKKDLLKLVRTSMGRNLLKDIMEHDKPVVIRPTMSNQGGLVKPSDESNARRTHDQSGVGSGATVHIPHGLKDDTFVVYRKPPFMGFRRRSPEYEIPGKGEEIAQPRFMTLAHELVHAHRGQRGLIEPKGSNRNDGYLNQEEFQTINGDYTYTENKLRRAFGMPSRFGHFHHRTSMKS